MSVDYNNFAKTFSSSRKNMKWEEIDFFMELIKEKKSLNILDIWCWNWRLLWELLNNKINISNYIWVDLSKWLLVEAKEQYQNFDFQELDMINLDKINKKFDVIFFIASFNHLDNLENRLETLKKAYNLLNNWGIIFMTNWALDSELNYEKYKKSIIYWSENHFWSKDYDIKIWKFIRYYHCFNLKELEYIFLKNWFKIIKNKLFNNKKNYISVIEKK